MASNVESQARLIREQIITQAEKDQAKKDVRGESTSQWNSARLSVRLLDETEGELSPGAVRVAVAALYYCSDSTIRRREPAARMVTPEDVEQHPKLFFSHWRAACDARHLGTPLESMWDIIRQIYEYEEEFGDIPTVNVVQGWVSGDGNMVRMPWFLRFESTVATLEKNKVDEYLEPDGRSLAGYCQVLIQSYLETGRSPLTIPPQEGGQTPA